MGDAGTASASPRGRVRRPNIGKGDLLAALTTGIANVPDGMASAVLAGVNPILGIYTLVIGTPLSALTASTQLMMFNTTSAMTLVAADGLVGRTGDNRVRALIVIALVAGLFQIAAGLLGLGRLTRFVSNAVMTGFLTGIGVRIILNQLWDLTGYNDDLGGSLLERTARLLSNLPQVDPWTTAIGLGSITVMVLLGRGKLADFNLLIALALATVAGRFVPSDSVALVSSLGEVPRSLPPFEIPHLSLIPEVWLSGIAMATVGLLQAAGVAQAYPNPDGSETSDSRDFLSQGIANSATACFSGMAGGGSLSGTALLVSAGAQTRWAAVLQAAVVIAIVLTLGGVLGLVPMAALAALLVYAAALSLKFGAIDTISHTSVSSFLSMAVTFLATLFVPLQQAILVGVILSAVLYLYRSSTDVRVTELMIDNGQISLHPAPTRLKPHDVTLLQIEGSSFYAGARSLLTLLPTARGVDQPVVVLGLRGMTDLGSSFFKVIGSYANQVRSAGGRLMLAGVEPNALARLERTHMVELIGRENVFPAGSVLGDSATEAVRAGRAWLDGKAPPSPTPPRPSTNAAAVQRIEIGSVVAPAAPPPPVEASANEPGVPSAGAWWHLAGPEALLAAALVVVGLVLDRERAVEVLPWVGLLLVLASVVWAAMAAGTVPSPSSALGGTAAGIALLAGAMLVADPWLGLLGPDAGFALLWATAALLGGLGVVGTAAFAKTTTGRLVTAAASLALGGLGVVGIAGIVTGDARFNRVGWVLLLVAGGLLGAALAVRASDGRTSTG